MSHEYQYQTTPNIRGHAFVDPSNIELRNHQLNSIHAFPNDLFRTFPAPSNNAFSPPISRPEGQTPFGVSGHSPPTRLAEPPQNGRQFPEDGAGRGRPPRPPAQPFPPAASSAVAASAFAASAIAAAAAPAATPAAAQFQGRPAHSAAAAEGRDGGGGDIELEGAQPVFRSALKRRA